LRSISQRGGEKSQLEGMPEKGENIKGQKENWKQRVLLGEKGVGDTKEKALGWSKYRQGPNGGKGEFKAHRLGHRPRHWEIPENTESNIVERGAREGKLRERERSC